MTIEDRLILNRDTFKATLERLFGDLNKDKDLLSLFLKNPVYVMRKYGVIISDRDFSVSAANRLLFVALSNPKLKEWADNYEAQIRKEHKGVLGASTIDRVRIYKDFAKVISESMDIDLNEALITAMSPVEVAVDAKIIADSSVQVGGPPMVNTCIEAKVAADVGAMVQSQVIVCGPDFDTVMTMETAIAMAVVAVAVAVVVAVAAAVAGVAVEGLQEGFDRREFAQLFDAIERGLNERAEWFRKRLREPV